MKELNKNIFLLIDVLKASFISLIPYYVLYSLVLLLIQLLKYFSLDIPLLEDYDITNISLLVGSVFPILICLSVSYHLGTIYYPKINKLLLVSLALITFLTVELLRTSNEINSFILPKLSIISILVPLCTSYLLKRFLLIMESYLQALNKSVSKNIVNSVIYILPYTFTFLASTFIFYLLSKVFDFSLDSLLIQDLSSEALMFIRMVFSHFFWFIGIHGGNFFDAIVSVDFKNNPLIENLSIKEFYDLFIITGGSGAGLSLLLAIFISSRDKHITNVGKLAFPFAIFNINEILLFGLPIFLNFSLIIPFILVPIVNFILAYFLIVTNELIVFNSMEIPWTTPALINIYLLSDGSILALAIQVFIIIMGTLIYMPFIKKYSLIQSSSKSLEKIANKLEINLAIESKREIKFQEAQSTLVQAHYKVNELIDLINKNDLLLYYQPKVNIKENKVNCFESLLRIKNQEGKITGPSFLIDIENSGLASIIDIWVCKKVREDFSKWKEMDFNPNIAVNIFPYTLEDEFYVNQIISILKGLNITIEIIERRSALNEKIIKNLHLLKANGFKISLDDLGVGYTNFSVLYEFPLDSVKIDRDIINATETKKGYILYLYICKLCANLGYEIVLEGLETKKQLDKLNNKYISRIQGWYYSKALPFEEVFLYSKYFKV